MGFLCHLLNSEQVENSDAPVCTNVFGMLIWNGGCKMHLILLSRYQQPHLIQILELLSFLGVSFVFILFLIVAFFQANLDEDSLRC